jgi:hypothetical protein
MEKTILSMFTEKYNELMSINNVDELKQSLFTIIKEANEGTMWSRKITLNIININNLNRLQAYVTNSMLKYQGMGLNRW